MNTSGEIVAHDGANNATGTIVDTNQTVVLVMKVDRSIPQIVVYNNGNEVLKPTWSAPVSGSMYLYLENNTVLYGAYWTGVDAQLSDAQVGTLISLMRNGR